MANITLVESWSKKCTNSALGYKNALRIKHQDEIVFFLKGYVSSNFNSCENLRPLSPIFLLYIGHNFKLEIN